MLRSGPGPIQSASGLMALGRAGSFAAGVSVATAAFGTSLSAIAAAAALVAILRRHPGAGAATAARFLVPAVLGLGCALFHQGCGQTPDLLRAWAAAGFEAHHTPVLIEGRVSEAVITPRHRARLTVRLQAYRLPGRCRMQLPRRWPARLRLSVPLPGAAIASPWHAGDTVVATARLGPPRQFGNPGAFDYAAYLEARGIDLLGTVKSVRLISLRPAPRASSADLLPAARRVLIGRLRRAAGPEDRRTPAFLSALLVGEREHLPPDLITSLKYAGIYHIVALSGMHVGLVILLLAGLLRLVPLSPPLRRCLMIAGIGLYAAMVRDSGSIARATLMAVLYLSGGILSRRLSPVGVVSTAAMILLCVRPVWIGDAGFHLTFAATLGVVATASRYRAGRPVRLSRSGMLRGHLTASIRMSTGVLLATAPITATHFHIVVPAALVMNLFAVPLAAVLLLLAIVISLAQPTAAMMAHLLCHLASLLLDLLLRLAQGMAILPGAWFHVLPPPPALVLALAFAGILLALGGRRLRRLALASIMVLTFRLVAAGRTTLPPPGTLEVTALDVGQGDAILVRLPTGLTALIDAGGFPGSNFDVGARVVGPALRSMGILRLDLLILTHAHTDHIGGASAVLREFAPRALWFGAVPPDDPMVRRLLRQSEELDIPVVFPRRGVVLSFGGSRLQVLNPAGVDPRGREGANRGSLALRIVLHHRQALLTGDLERASEGELLLSGFDLRAGLLKVGHHGSRTSTGTDFLHAVNPSIALISVGSTNPWGHPHDDVVERLRAAGSIVHRSDRDGAVRYRTDGHTPWFGVPFASWRERRDGFRSLFRTQAESSE